MRRYRAVLSGFHILHGGDPTRWLGREDSNLGIRIDGYSPDGAIALSLARYLNAPPARSPGGSESQRGHE
jgi:hypothetical protein